MILGWGGDCEFDARVGKVNLRSRGVVRVDVGERME